MAPRVYIVETNPQVPHALADLLHEVAGAAIAGLARDARQGADWLAAHPSDWDIAIVALPPPKGAVAALRKACHNRPANKKVALFGTDAGGSMHETCHQWHADAFFDNPDDIGALLDFCLAHASAA